jgi:peptidoglycan hydrolase-like protein with peptidoglycan-binding domain
MTIQLPALARGASLIATVAATLVAAALVIVAPAVAANRSSTPVLAQGAGLGDEPNAHVRQVQRALERRGYDVGAPGVDGRFGPLTAAAVRRLQADRGLAVDGIVGQRTRRALGLPRRSFRRSHARAEKAATRAHKPHATQGSAVGSPGSAATPPSPSNELLDESQRSSDATVATVVLWVAIAGFAALALAAAWRRVARTRRARLGWLQMYAPLATAAPPSVSAAQRAGPASAPPPRERAIGYVTVGPDASAAQHDRASAAIADACERSDWDLLGIVCDRGDGRPLDRPGLADVLGRIADGQARRLVVSDLRSFSRSAGDLGGLLAWFRDTGATLVALDLGLDTSTRGGRRVADTLIALGGEEAARIEHHATDASTQARADGRAGARDHVLP